MPPAAQTDGRRQTQGDGVQLGPSFQGWKTQVRLFRPVKSMLVDDTAVIRPLAFSMLPLKSMLPRSRQPSARD